jgi:hypothetical protein
MQMLSANQANLPPRHPGNLSTYDWESDLLVTPFDHDKVDSPRLSVWWRTTGPVASTGWWCAVYR